MPSAAAADVRAVKASLKRRRWRRTTMGSCHQVAARDRAWMTKMSSRRLLRRRTTKTMTRGVEQCWG